MAVLLVLWAHLPAGVFGPLGTSIHGWVKPGYLGVDVFFVLSGFLITRILLVDKAAGQPLRWFLLRRFLRIFPIYYLTLAVLAVAHPGPEIPWCFAYLSNAYFPFQTETSWVRHTWSLAVEEHFYLVWPFLVYALSVAASRRVAAWVVLPLAILFSYAVIRSEQSPAVMEWVGRLKAEGRIAIFDPKRIIYMATVSRAASLALGALFAYGEDGIRRRARRSALLAVTALVLVGLIVRFLLVHLPLDWYPLARLFLFTAASGALVVLVIAGSSLRFSPTAILASAPLRGIGRISYGFYLYQLPVFCATGLYRAPYGTDGVDGLYVALRVALALGVAIVSYFVIERPLLRLGARFRGPSPRPAALAPPAPEPPAPSAP